MPLPSGVRLGSSTAGSMPAPGALWTDDFSSLFEVVEFDD